MKNLILFKDNKISKKIIEHQNFLNLVKMLPKLVQEATKKIDIMLINNLN